MRNVRIIRGNMEEMLQAVRELEVRGYDYVTKIKQRYKSKKFECWMKKVN
ncbi:hypothetical protein [Bacillus mycoides]|nr:hypothetical protein [Bacillus mycoides]MCQ6530532.1 hypothetical protein [Bacillus mycoides]